jgi:hypothetical protein
MMETQKEEVTYHSPDKLLAGFSKGRIVVWMAIAIMIHVVFIGMTSIGYIRDRLDPEGAKARQEAAAAALKEKNKEAPKPAETTTNSQVSKSVSSSSTGSEDRLMEERKDTPVVKRITEKAKTNEIPVQPNDIGISIDDTNVH